MFGGVTILYRTVNERQRYYTIQLLSNLFGESMVIRTYGSMLKSKPSGEIRQIYTNEVDAQHAVDVLIVSKCRRGYCSKPTQQ